MHGADQGPADLSEDEAEEEGHDEDEDAVSSTMTPSSSQICTPESAMVSPMSNHSANRPMSGNAIHNFNPFHNQREIPARQFPTASSNGLIHSRSDENTAYENDNLGMGVQTYIPPPRMSDMQQHQPHQNHGLSDQSRRPTTWSSSSNGFPYTPNWSSNHIMGNNTVGYNYHSPATTAPLRSNDTILPPPNPSASLLAPINSLHAGRQHQSFNDSSSMNFRDHSGVHGGGVVGNPNNSLRPNNLSNSQHHPQHYQTSQTAYGMNEYMHDYSQGDAVMKDENIGGGGGGS